MGEVLLEVRRLKKCYPIRTSPFSRIKRYVRAVDDVSFSINNGETLSLVGESGCGKTTTGKLTLRLVEPTGGDIFFNGQSILKLTKSEMRHKRRQMQIVFQDPYGSLDPRMSVGDIIGEAIVIHNNDVDKRELRDAVRGLLNKVGLSDDCIDYYPHEFSGGQRQRICIARAIALKPSFIVCDEPVSSLDASIRAQIIDLLEGLQEDYGISYLFIAHDLAIVRRISDVVAVMFKGRIVEMAGTEELYGNPLHPYTRRLLSAIPSLDPFVKRLRLLSYDEAMDQSEPANGCSFYKRCSDSLNVCKYEAPRMVESGTGHFVNCHRY